MISNPATFIRRGPSVLTRCIGGFVDICRVGCQVTGSILVFDVGHAVAGLCEPLVGGTNANRINLIPPGCLKIERVYDGRVVIGIYQNPRVGCPTWRSCPALWNPRLN